MKIMPSLRRHIRWHILPPFLIILLPLSSLFRRAVSWEDAFLDVIDRAERSGQFQYISTARFASRTLDVELEQNMRAVTPYFATTFGIMIFFSIITSMMTDWVRSKPMLGLLGNVSAGMGTVAAFGLAVYCGVDFIGINFIAPFLTCSKCREAFSYEALSSG